jgi:hypothetical protein
MFGRDERPLIRVFSFAGRSSAAERRRDDMGGGDLLDWRSSKSMVGSGEALGRSNAHHRIGIALPGSWLYPIRSSGRLP